MVSEVRKKVVAPCTVGPMSFVAASISGGGRRNLVEHSGVGEDGGDLEDTGEAARTEVVVAEMDEDQVTRLEGLRRAAVPYDITHPLFGSFRGRIAEVRYNADFRDMVDVTITLKEDGQHKARPKPKLIDTETPKKRAKELAREVAVNSDQGPEFTDTDQLSELYQIFLKIPLDWITLLGEYSSLADSSAIYYDAIDRYDAGDASSTEIDAAGEQLLESTRIAIEMIEDYAVDEGGDTEWLAEFSEYLTDLASAILELQGALSTGQREKWETFSLRGHVSVSQLLDEYMGGDTEANFEEFMEQNPYLIDACIILSGTQINIPIAA